MQFPGKCNLIYLDGRGVEVNQQCLYIYNEGFLLVVPGIERLCMCTWSGKLKFYQVNQQQGVEGSQSRSGEGAISKTPASQDAGENKKGLVDDDAFEGSPGKVPAGEKDRCTAHG